MKVQLTTRFYFSLAFYVALLILASAIYFQFIRGYDPCPLCIMQRIVFIVITFILMIATLHTHTRLGWRIYSILIAIFSLIGMYFSIRQIWLQHLPVNEMENCHPDISIMIGNFPLPMLAREFFYGSAACRIVNWRFIGLSFAEWALVFFIFFFIFSIWQFKKNKNLF